MPRALREQGEHAGPPHTVPQILTPLIDTEVLEGTNATMGDQRPHVLPTLSVPKETHMQVEAFG